MKLLHALESTKLISSTGSDPCRYVGLRLCRAVLARNIRKLKANSVERRAISFSLFAISFSHLFSSAAQAAQCPYSEVAQ